MKKRQSGFSMIELMVVLGTMLIVTAMATPMVVTTLNMYRLRGACSDCSNLLQTARMRAITDDDRGTCRGSPTLRAGRHGDCV